MAYDHRPCHEIAQAQSKNLLPLIDCAVMQSIKLNGKSLQSQLYTQDPV